MVGSDRSGAHWQNSQQHGKDFAAAPAGTTFAPEEHERLVRTVRTGENPIWRWV